MNRLEIQRLESRRKTRDIYKVVGCLMPYRPCALTSAQLKLSSVRFMQQYINLDLCKLDLSICCSYLFPYHRRLSLPLPPHKVLSISQQSIAKDMLLSSP